MSYVEKINEAISLALDSHVEYETTHSDAGDGYAHLPREGGWMYHNGMDRLRAFMVENEIETTLDDETLEDLVLDNFEMTTGHTICPPASDVFGVDRFAVGEVELILEYSVLSEMTGLNITKARMEAIALNSREHCLKACTDVLLAYEVTDSTWDATITAKTLIELIKEEEERLS